MKVSQTITAGREKAENNSFKCASFSPNLRHLIHILSSALNSVREFLGFVKTPEHPTETLNVASEKRHEAPSVYVVMAPENMIHIRPQIPADEVLFCKTGL